MRKPRPVTITPSDNGGYLVQVGCKFLVFSTADLLLNNLRTYLADPDGTEKDFTEKHGWAVADEPAQPGMPFPNSAAEYAAAIGSIGGAGLNSASEAATRRRG